MVARGGLDQRQGGGGWSSAKGGELGIDRPGQHVLPRSSCIVNEAGDVEGRFTVALPAAGRTIQGGARTYTTGRINASMIRTD